MNFTVSLKENRQFRRLYAKGKSVVSPYLAIYYRKNGTPQSYLGITVSGKLGNAVVRNLLRRRLREIYRLQEPSLQAGYTIVVVARVRAVHATYQELDRSFQKLADKAKLRRCSLAP